ncbi:MAG TPA: sigma factor-like helix-turn-helix DNA-binding protein [Planctomycetota bacterium]|nr:sigma factor-like helix-turn-helix DNA-binding protein [Planctomycetota bacterium]
MDRRTSPYWHPPAWRGVASPGYLYASHWQALVGELGGLRCPSHGGAPPGEGVQANPFSDAGLENMSVLTEVQETEETGELREFVVKCLARHERLVLMLVHAERLSFRQVAQVLDLPEASVREIYSRTMATLRAHFSPSS